MKSTPRRQPADSARQRAARAAPRLASTKPSLFLALQTGPGVTELPASRAQCRRWILSALSQDADLTLRFVARNEARSLNAGYRSRDYAPDVLTFAYGSAADRSSDRLRADIVLCVPVLREQARVARIPFAWRLAHLVIHGVLHAQGHDHEREDQARVMQSLETAALRRFNIPDPYIDR